MHINFEATYNVRTKMVTQLVSARTLREVCIIFGRRIIIMTGKVFQRNFIISLMFS